MLVAWLPHNHPLHSDLDSKWPTPVMAVERPPIRPAPAIFRRSAPGRHSSLELAAPGKSRLARFLDGGEELPSIRHFFVSRE